MITKYRSIESLLSDIDDDFDFNNTDWFSRAIGWIGRGIEKIGCVQSFEPKDCIITIEGGRGVLPCDIHHLMFFSSGIYHYRIKSDFTCQSLIENPDNYLDNKEYVKINQTYVFAPFDNGSLGCHYYAMPTDDCGYPLIVDNPFVTEALGWFVVYKLILSGYKHHTIKSWQDAKALWEEAYPRAQNSISFPSPQDMERFKNNWLGIVKSEHLLKQFFTV